MTWLFGLTECAWLIGLNQWSHVYIKDLELDTNTNKANEPLRKFNENLPQRRNASLPFCAILSSSFSVSWAPGKLWIELDWTCGHCVAGAARLQTLLKTLKLTPQDLSLVLLFLATKQRLARCLEACGPVMFLICPRFRTRMPKDLQKKTAHCSLIINSTIYLRHLPPEV